MPYNAYVEQALLRPLGMTSTGFEVLKSPVERRAIGYRWVDGAWVEEPTMADGAFNSMGGLQTSANDYADRTSTSLNSVTNAHLVCSLLLETKKQLLPQSLNNTD